MATKVALGFIAALSIGLVPFVMSQENSSPKGASPHPGNAEPSPGERSSGVLTLDMLNGEWTVDLPAIEPAMITMLAALPVTPEKRDDIKTEMLEVLRTSTFSFSREKLIMTSAKKGQLVKQVEVIERIEHKGESLLLVGKNRKGKIETATLTMKDGKLYISRGSSSMALVLKRQ
jgi:hypothetical protein